MRSACVPLLEEAVPLSPAVSHRHRLFQAAAPLRCTRGRFAVAILLAGVLLAAAGCASSPVSLRSVPKSPLIDELNLASYGGPKPSARTVQLLRVYNLSDDLGGDYPALLKKLQAISDREPAADTVYAMSELAFIGGKKTERHDPKAALDLYGASVLHAYDYLFDPRFAATRNQYDPQYRGACDLYNGALESALRIICATKELVPNTTKTINTASGAWDVNCVLQGGRWQPQDFERFEFVSDYDINGAEKPLPDARPGRAADRRPPQLPRRAGRGEILSRRPEFPGHRLPPPHLENRSANRPDRRPKPVLPRTVRPAGDRHHAGRRPAGAVGERSEHAAGLFPLAARDESRHLHPRAAASRGNAEEAGRRPAGNEAAAEGPLHGAALRARQDSRC